MAVNRLAPKQKSSRSLRKSVAYQVGSTHEALEMSLCDEGMCFVSPVQHEIGAVLIVDFEPNASKSGVSLKCEAVVVDCRRASCGESYETTVLFTDC